VLQRVVKTISKIPSPHKNITPTYPAVDLLLEQWRRQGVGRPRP